MNANDIVQQAKDRLAELEAEAAKLRAIIAAAEGRAIAAPPYAPPPAFIPYVDPHPMPWHPQVPWPLDRITCTEIRTDTAAGMSSVCAWLGDPMKCVNLADPVSSLDVCTGILPEPDGKVFGPGPDIDTTTIYR